MVPFALSDVVVVPQRTEDPIEAARLVSRDGAAVIPGRVRSVDHITAIVREVWPTGVTALEPPNAEERSLSTMPPDVVAFWLPNDQPTETFFAVDLGLVHHELVRAGGQWVDLAAFVVGHPVDLAPPGQAPRSGTIAMQVPDGSLLWECTYCLAPLPEDCNVTGTLDMLALWMQLLNDLADAAQDIVLRPGELLLFDHRRVAHGCDLDDDVPAQAWRTSLWGDVARSAGRIDVRAAVRHTLPG